MKSQKQLGWLLAHHKNFFFLHVPGRRLCGLSLWPKQGGVLVCEEAGNDCRFVPWRRMEESLLGQAIREGRLYIDVSI